MDSDYSWGVDGFGRQHICKSNDNKIIACAVYCQAFELIDILSEQERNDINCDQA